jgi:hypothetical protein
MLGASGTMDKRKKKSKVKSPISSTVTTAIAGSVSSAVGRTRQGRDSLTRTNWSPIKVVDTHGRQWNRYSP